MRRPNLRAARFADERPAGLVYTAVQQAIFAGPPNDLSACRFPLDRINHVIVLDEPPQPELDVQSEPSLASGECAELRVDVLHTPSVRRCQMTRRVPWTERHSNSGWQVSSGCHFPRAIMAKKGGQYGQRTPPPQHCRPQ
jgi:hypothetical protein